MRIIERWKDLVHTHFVTDGERLTARATRDLQREFSAVLRASGIVFPIHLARAGNERTIRVVLECQPEPQQLERLARELSRILAPLPVQPPSVLSVNVVRD